MSHNRTELQAQVDRIDQDLFSVIDRIERLADRIPIAGPRLRGVAIKLSIARDDLRSFMHPADREVTQ